MDPRQPLVIALLLTLVACTGRGDSPDATAPERAGVTPASLPTSRAAAESAGLVGTDVSAERIVLEDVGPPAPTIAFTAGLKGYTEPCGCTMDLILGGIDRVAGVTGEVRAMATSSLVLDAGNLLFEYPDINENAVAQERRKTEVMIAALGAMQTRATTIGPSDLALGIDFYLSVLGQTPIDVLGANVTLNGGAPFALPWAAYALGESQVAVIGAASVEAFIGRDDVEVSPALDAIGSAVEEIVTAGHPTTVLLFQGTIQQARAELAGLGGVDFIIIGQPRQTDEMERIGDAWTLEAFDQGRYLGRLKLLTSEREGELDWQSARAGSEEEIARLQRVIEGIEAQLTRMELPAGEPVPPIVQRQRDRITTHQAELAAMEGSAIDFERGPRVFYFEPIGLSPGYATDPSVTAEMIEYNQALRALNLAGGSPAIPANPGEPGYVGQTVCATCHPAAAAFWATSEHAGAIQTLTSRGKEYDRSCIGCHMTGYEQPGGSSLGEWRGLENVQCEQCHGPGEFHARAPTEWLNVPNGVHTATTEQTCIGCHNEEHSTTFEYNTYLPRVLGPGHGHPQ